MGKFKISLELTGLKFSVEGEREDIPMLTKNVAAQIAGQLMPIANLAEGKTPPVPGRDPIDVTPRVVEQLQAKTRQRSARRSSGAGGSAVAQESPTVLWQHDANAWGTPLQGWKATDKAIWLLYVAKQVGAAAEMTPQQMVNTFAKLFRTAGKLDRGNITRDFGKLTSEPPAKVATNGTVEPPTWYLTDAGIKHAESLVKAARGEASAG